MTSTSPIRVGIIGTGNAGRRLHTDPLRQMPDHYTVVAGADAVPAAADAFAADYDVIAHSTVASLLADNAVELVVIATKPPTTHHAVGLAALAAGKHVVLEKPMAETPAECAELIAAAAAADRVLTVHHNRRWDVDFLNARDAVAAGLMGALRLVRNEWCAGFAGSPYDWGIHIIDQSMQLSEGQSFTELSATMALPNSECPTAGEGFFSARLRRDDGVLYDLGMLPGVNGSAVRPGTMTPRFYIAGTGGVMIQDWCQRPQDAFGSSVRFETATAEQPAFGDPPSVQASLAVPGFYELLHAAIRNGGPPPVCAQSAARSVQAWALICESATTGRTLQVTL
jgi:predicted dehydrogenase